MARKEEQSQSGTPIMRTGKLREPGKIPTSAPMGQGGTTRGSSKPAGSR